MCKKFVKPVKPFLLIEESYEGYPSYYWCETETEIIALAQAAARFGGRVICAIEIGSCRDIDHHRKDD